MSTVNRSELRQHHFLTLALSFGKNRLYLVGPNQAPLWLRQRALWKKPLVVVWHRIDDLPGHWWLGQQGRELVILGQGERPPLLLEREGGRRWQAFVPSGHQSLVVKLPDMSPYRVKVIRER